MLLHEFGKSVPEHYQIASFLFGHLLDEGRPLDLPVVAQLLWPIVGEQRRQIVEMICFDETLLGLLRTGEGTNSQHAMTEDVQDDLSDVRRAIHDFHLGITGTLKIGPRDGSGKSITKTSTGTPASAAARAPWLPEIITPSQLTLIISHLGVFVAINLC
jgi:hypothetical protein